MDSIGMVEVRVTVTVTPDFPVSAEGKFSSFWMMGKGLSAQPIGNWEPVTVVTLKQNFLAPGNSFFDRNMVSFVVKMRCLFSILSEISTELSPMVEIGLNCWNTFSQIPRSAMMSEC